MSMEGGWEFVRIIGESGCTPVELTEEGLEELGSGPVNLVGKIGRPLWLLDESSLEDVLLVQTLDGVLAKVASENLEEYVPDAGENGGFDCAWPLTRADNDPGGWDIFGQTVCEHVRWKGFCVVHLNMSHEERRNLRTPVASFSSDVWRRLPSDVEEVYLGRSPRDKMCWMQADQNSLDVNDALHQCDSALTELAALLSPFTDEYFNFSGCGRTGTMIRTPIQSDNELKSLQRFMMPIPGQELSSLGGSMSSKVESYVSFAQLRRLCIMQFAAGSGGVLRLHPKFGISWLEEVDIPCQENRLVIFRHDLMSYTYAPSNSESVVLQAWMLSEPHAAAASGLEDAGMKELEHPFPQYGQSGQAVGVMSMHKNLPGSVQGCDQNWAMFVSATDTTLTVPTANRWQADLYYEPDKEQAVNKIYSNHGGFLAGDDMWVFDTDFFEICEEEALSMDPGHRKGLEIGYQCLKKAGFSKDTLLGKHIGVYVGNSGSDWNTDQENVLREKGSEYLGTANASQFLATRIAHAFGLRGTCQVDDTACSSSLIAVNIAFWGLRPQEPGQLRPSQGRQAKWALVAGINALVGPYSWIGLCGPKMLSPRGRCFTFDGSADGFNRAEGMTAITMKHLEESEEQSDRLAMVCGACINQDGRSASMTAPHGPSQQECIRNSLREANLTPSDICIAELHGTGTALGDPIEVGALRGVMRVRRNPIIKTSGKVNYGHLEATAGVSGFSKCVMMLTRGIAAPNVHLRYLNGNIDTNQYPVIIEDESVACANSGYAGVSSFGFGGTNGRGDVWARAITGVFNTGGDWYGMDRLQYVKGRKQDFVDRSNALEDPDFSDAFKEKLMMHLRADYVRKEADSIAKDWRLMQHTWLGEQIAVDPEPLPIGPGTGKAQKAAQLEALPEISMPALADQAGQSKTPEPTKSQADQAMTSEPFTKSRALAMQEALLSYYQTDEFQSSIRSILAETKDDRKAFMAARSNLLFEKVQIHVLGRYGFEISKKGVSQSQAAFQPYNDDPDVGVNNLRMMYYTFPELQTGTVEQYVEEQIQSAKKSAADAHKAKEEPGKPMPPTGESEAFTVERALAMQEELITGYRNPDFQNKIRGILEEAKGDRKAFMTARSTLLFEMVQTHLMEKYGFENSKKGVMQSNRVFVPFSEHPDVARNNAIMQYLTMPDLQEVSLDSYVEEALKQSS